MDVFWGHDFQCVAIDIVKNKNVPKAWVFDPEGENWDVGSAMDETITRVANDMTRWIFNVKSHFL